MTTGPGSLGGPGRPDPGRSVLGRRQLTVGATRMAAFGLSMLVLAIVSLLLIPELIRAGGPEAWGSIAVGQSIGVVAAVVIALGWGVSGPAAVARADRASRRREFSESMVARAAASVPTLAVAAALAAAFGRPRPELAVLAATSLALVGLSSNWYFVGTAQPWLLFVGETVPRAVGSVAGLVLLRQGAHVAVGLLGQLVGILAAALITWAIVLRTTRTGEPPLPRRPLRVVVSEQRHGVATTVLSAAYGSSPVLIVRLVSPDSLPVFALLDKFQRQLYTATTPFVAVLQGWVARAKPGAMRRRILASHLVTAACVVVGGVALFVARDLVFGWLGAGAVVVPPLSAGLMCLWLALNVQESIAARVALVPLGRIDFMARATAIGTVIGLGATALLAARWGTDGALVGVCLGLVIRIALCFYGARPAATSPALTAPAPTVTVQEML